MALCARPKNLVLNNIHPNLYANIYFLSRDTQKTITF